MIGLSTLIEENEAKYCDLFVSLVYYEYDNTLPYYHYIFSNNTIFFYDVFWSNLFNNDLERRYIPNWDSKRTSYYIAKQSGHMTFMDSNWTLINTKCNEAPTLKEYISDVIGDKSLVKKYYGKSIKRIREFPKYSWNNLNIECLQC